MKTNAIQYKESDPRAVNSTLKSHYVDDFLESCDTELEAVNLAKAVHKIHQQAGFHIRNWISNSQNVIQILGENNLDEKKSLNVSNNMIEIEKVLGMWWNTTTDYFTYSLAFN